MARISGITIEKDINGKARYARIDLRKYADDLRGFFNDKGIVIDEVKLTSKLKRSIDEAKNSNFKQGDIKNFWE